MKNVSYVTIGSQRHEITDACEYLAESGHYQSKWHRFVRGWCEKLNRWVTFCLGVVKSKIVEKWYAMTGQRHGVEKRILARSRMRTRQTVSHGLVTI